MVGVGQSPGKGRGIFAWTFIPAGTLIEEAPVLVVPAAEMEHLDRTVLSHYYFLWGPEDAEGALVLSIFALCNHSYQPNAIFIRDADRGTISFFSRRDLQPGEEITINYHGDPDSGAPLDFLVRP